MQETFESTLEHLAHHGCVLTMQRRAIVGLLHDQPGHWTAERIFSALKGRYSTLSRATVYKTLELLCDTGEVEALCICKDVTHYDTNTAPHHHFHCVRCGTLIDLEFECPVESAGRVQGHRVERMVAIFHGTCHRCLESTPPRR
jgi:Fur family peroxide stress response transcriptional regulator